MIVAKYCYLLLPRFCLWGNCFWEHSVSIYYLESCLYLSGLYIFSLLLWFLEEFPFHSCLCSRELCPLPSCLFIRGLCPLPSCPFVRGLSPLPCSMVDFLAAWFKLFLAVSFVVNSAILLIGVFTFGAGLLDYVLIWGCFSLWLCVLS